MEATEIPVAALGTRVNSNISPEFDVDAHHLPQRCEHPSSSGIDPTPVDDPAKVWLCHSCFAHHLADGTRVLDPAIHERWNDFWEELVTRTDGTLDLDQVKCELHDYSICIEEVPKVYGEITANTMSKPGYRAVDVLAVHDERCPNVTALIEEIRELFESRGDYEDVVDSVDAASRLEEVLERHETLHSGMYREDREKKDVTS